MSSRGSSVIDYVITNQEFFKYFSKFSVDDPNILSDHCRLNFELNFSIIADDIRESHCETQKNESQFCNGKYVWNDEKANTFLNDLQSESVIQKISNISDTLSKQTQMKK